MERIKLHVDHSGPHTFTERDRMRTVVPGETFDVDEDRGLALLKHFPSRFSRVTAPAAGDGDPAAPPVDAEGGVLTVATLDAAKPALEKLGHEPEEQGARSVDAAAQAAEEAAANAGAEIVSIEITPETKFRVTTENNQAPHPSGVGFVTIPPGDYTKAEYDAAVLAAAAAADAAPAQPRSTQPRTVTKPPRKRGR